MVTSSELPSSFLRDLLCSVLDDDHVNATTEYEVTKVSDESSVLTVYRVVVLDQSDGLRRRLSLTFKWIPAHCSGENTENPFFNEVIFYDRVLPTLLRFQQAYIEAVSTPYSHTPRCLKCVRDSENDAIVLEDLEPRSLDEMNIEELRVLFQQLGRFHALSLAMQHKDPAHFQQVISEATPGPAIDCMDRRFKAAWSDVIARVKRNFPPDSEYVCKTQRFVDEISERLDMLSTPDPDEPYNVINRGHFRYGSLALDLSAALVCTEKRMREDLLRVYHDALSGLANELSSYMIAVIPLQALDVLLLRYAQFGVAVAVVRLHGLNRVDRVLEVIKEAVDERYFDQLVVPCVGAYESTRL